MAAAPPCLQDEFVGIPAREGVPGGGGRGVGVKIDLSHTPEIAHRKS